MIRVLVVDDHVLFRESLVSMLRESFPQLVPIEAASVAEALSALAFQKDVDLILLDLALPDASDLSAVVRLREAAPEAPLVVLSGTEDREIVGKALDRGALGFVHKSASSREMIHAMERVIAGDTYVPLAFLATAGLNHTDPCAGKPARTADPASAAGLTPRQMEVLKLLYDGLSNKGIARGLGLSEATVKLHVSAILRALQARNRTQAVLAATRLGLLNAGDG